MKDSIISIIRKNRIQKMIVAIIWIVIWIVISNHLNNELFLPGPRKVVLTLQSMIKTKNFWISILYSTYKIGMGFLLGLCLGLIFGGVASKIHLLRLFLSPMISIIKTIPVASFIILILVWVNSKQLSTCISFLVTFPMIYIAVLEGYDHVNQQLLEMVKVYKVKPITQLRYLYLSEIHPFVISSAKVAVGLSWKAGISGEIIGLPTKSIGEQLYLSKLYLDISQLFAWTVVIVIICYVFEKIMLGLLYLIQEKLLT